MGLTAAMLSMCLPQAPAAAGVPPPILPEVVLCGLPDPVPASAFGLGDGGIDTAHPPRELTATPDGCRTPQGVQVRCAPEGVLLTFPSQRELLIAPDGFAHLRSGEAGGPYPSGLELRLGDGACVRITLAPAERERIREVVVVAGDRALQVWRRGSATAEVVRPGFWAGVRVACCGDGGDLYRAIALGPLLTLERDLVAEDRAEKTPAQQLVVLTATLIDALERLPRQAGTGDPGVRPVVAAVAATVDRRDVVFPEGAALQRAERDSLRWLLRGGYELELVLAGQRAPRLGLCSGSAPRPFVEWALGGSSPAVFLANPRAGEPGASRWFGNGLTLARVAPELQAREVLQERARALRVLGRFAGQPGR